MQILMSSLIGLAARLRASTASLMPASLILVSVRSRHERRDNKFVVATRGAKVPIALGAPHLANLGGGDDAAV
jgi:hypothetical protein